MSSPRLTSEEVTKTVDKGYAILPSCLDDAVLHKLDSCLSANQAGLRNLLDVPVIRQLALSRAVRGAIEPVLGPNCFAVRGILFNKVAGANWKVAWHQDCVIAVLERREVPGWGPWSIKAGIHHVRPSAEVMSGMLAIRLHLDDCGDDDGPLRVLPGSHQYGFLSDKCIQAWPKDGATTCIAKRGDAILLRPLSLHASSAARVPSNRRVVHLEFAVKELPPGIKWHERV